MTDVKVGDKIQIEYMVGEPQYSGRKGIVRCIDDMGQIHGSWGGLALNDGDVFRVLNKESERINSLDLPDQVSEMRYAAQCAGNDYAMKDIDEAVQQEIFWKLEEYDIDVLLRTVRNLVGEDALIRLRNRCRNILQEYNIEEDVEDA